MAKNKDKRTPKKFSKRTPKKTFKYPLHPETHLLVAKALASTGPSSLPATQARLILLLESYARVNPVVPATPIGSATWDLDILAADINERWNFPPGNEYHKGDLIGTTSTQAQAQDIYDNGGVLNGR